MEYREIETAWARRFCERLFASYGFSAREAAVITDALLRADLCGIESHGVQRLVRYDDEIRSGMVDVHARPEVVFETGISAVVDAHKAMGQLVGVFAMDLAIRKARETGFGVVTARDSNHFGIAGYYSVRAAEAGLLGIAMTNSEAIAVPTFGREAMIGTNPIALAMPAAPTTFSFDAATTVVPRGKLEVYNKIGKPLPARWALDETGGATTDAARVLDNIIHKRGGGIAPLGGVGEEQGGHKGYGLGIIVDLFTGVFSGGLTSDHVNRAPGRTGICHCFMALDYGIFGDKPAIEARFSAFLAALRASARARGQDRIYVHGEKEAELMARRAAGSFPVNDKTWAEMQALSARIPAV